MDFLMKKVRVLRSIFRAEDQEEKREITRLKGYLELIYKVLSWQDPTLTLTTFLVLNFIFW